MITLSKSGSTVTFTFDENSGYLQNGTIEVPLNSLSLILDESNMATFRKSASNDIFVSANIAEFGMSKSELEAWYKSNMVGSTGGGGGGVTPEEVQGMIDESISGKADSVSAVSSAEYVSSSTTIEFKNADGDVISSIDASDFVIDGMVDDVRIDTISGVSYLVIDFNTASGKEDIQIPLTDIFDPSNYYTKAEVDAALSGKADTSAVTASINSAVSGKQDTLIEGRAIDITNNTISLDLPISAGTGTNSIQEGSNTEASGNYSHAEGQNTKTSGNNSHAEGYATSAVTIYSHAEGRATEANGQASHAEGNSTKASGNYSHAEGSSTKASGESSHAEGFVTSATSEYSHAEGVVTSANGQASHAEGNSTKANGNYSHAEGYQSKANSSSSHAEGYNTEANNECEHASGRFNVSSIDSPFFGTSGNTLFSVGNGTANNARHNAFEIRQNGDIYLNDGSKLQDNLFSGSYDDLTDKPTIPTSASQLTNDAGYATSGYVDSSVSGKVDTSSVVTAVTSASTDAEIPTAKAVWEAASGGGTGESCTVDATTIYDIYSARYDNSGYDLKVRYVVLDYAEDKTVASYIMVQVQFRDDSYNYYVNQYIYLDYTTSSYTLSDQSQAQYIDITYDPTIEDFKIAVASAYTSTVFVTVISDFFSGYIKVPFYTISSGSPCTVIENDIPNVVSEIREGLSEAIKSANLTSQKSFLNSYTQTIGGRGDSYMVKLDEIDGSNNTLKPDIYVGLGTSGWTEINLTEQCTVNNLKGTKFRVTYDYSEFNAYNMNLQLIVEWGTNQTYGYVTFDDNTQEPSLNAEETFSAATIEWSASTKELVITYPTTIDWYGDQVLVNIDRIDSNACQFGQTIIKLESYGENKQALKPYVQQNRAALTNLNDRLSEDEEVTAASLINLNDKFGGLKLQKITQAAYDALSGNTDSNTLYVIVN